MKAPRTHKVLGRTVVRGRWRTVTPNLSVAELKDTATGVRCDLLRWTVPNEWGSYCRVEAGYLPLSRRGSEPFDRDALGRPVLDPRRTLGSGWTRTSEMDVVKSFVLQDAALGAVHQPATATAADRRMIASDRAALRTGGPLASNRSEPSR